MTAPPLRIALAYLPRPEKPVLERIHAGQSERLESGLHRIVKLRRVHKLLAPSRVTICIADAEEVETAVVVSVAELASKRHSKRRLTGQKKKVGGKE